MKDIYINAVDNTTNAIEAFIEENTFQPDVNTFSNYILDLQGSDVVYKNKMIVIKKARIVPILDSDHVEEIGFEKDEVPSNYAFEVDIHIAIKKQIK